MLNGALEEDKLDNGCVRFVVPHICRTLSNEELSQILSISVYVETSGSAEVPFGKRATIYPGPAPLQEIFLAELSGKYIKVHPVELGGEKTLRAQDPEWSRLEGDIESGRVETGAGSRKMLVAGKW